jgi:hypothetical protein
MTQIGKKVMINLISREDLNVTSGRAAILGGQRMAAHGSAWQRMV